MRFADRRLLLALCALAFAGALLIGRPEIAERASPVPSGTTTGAATPPVDTAAAGHVTVHVAGAVRRPGVYRLETGRRGHDAVRAAGGATRRADLGALNLAAPLLDGTQVLVPERGATGAVARAGGSSGAAQPAVVHLNAADAAALDALPGVGPATAARILAWRDEHGGFASVDDLLEVPGIGPARLETLRPLVAAP